jgi:hypothetical protein
MLIWLATVAAVAIIFLWFPTLILTKSYDPITVMVATGCWASIEAIHSRLAADRFRALAGVTVRSSIVTIIEAFSLLLAFGPLASLGGVLVGTIVSA